MTMSLRQAILHRVKDDTREELREVIQDSIGNAEVTLPGLGVLFELIWKHSAEEDKERMLQVLYDQVQQEASS
ncbi:MULTISPECIES: small acid-soluble spore protein SspI [Cohnella]|uniref:small acid-soluble spore protein SspI n=1 Tax=Cohnella TaxID=329857 RepID=UPI0009BBE637|nr:MULTISPECIES: small acid-soluble spore protein SspI [Cohnella]MBN2982724.1 small acid-soluble spore protein SspI [Cohnella algarum]